MRNILNKIGMYKTVITLNNGKIENVYENDKGIETLLVLNYDEMFGIHDEDALEDIELALRHHKSNNKHVFQESYARTFKDILKGCILCANCQTFITESKAIFTEDGQVCFNCNQDILIYHLQKAIIELEKTIEALQNINSRKTHDKAIEALKAQVKSYEKDLWNNHKISRKRVI